MTRTRGHRTDIRVTLTLAGFLTATACTSCSPGGAGSISVPEGKDKLRAVGKVVPSKTPPAETGRPKTAPRKR
jgi:hypothetical protein